MKTGFAYLKHWLSANNQHGIHSPFVYAYLTQCLYAKPKIKSDKVKQILLKSLAYFECKNFYTKNQSISNYVEKTASLNMGANPPYDMYYFDEPKENILQQHIADVHNESLILIDGIHQTKVKTALWKKLLAAKEITVSIDFYYCGVLFFRKEQVKQHFKIRI